MKILVINNSSNKRNDALKSLAQYNVTALDGRDGRKILQEQDFDIIIIAIEEDESSADGFNTAMEALFSKETSKVILTDVTEFSHIVESVLIGNLIGNEDTSSRRMHIFNMDGWLKSR